MNSRWSERQRDMLAAMGVRLFEAVRPEFLFTDRARGTLAAVSLAMWLRHSAEAAPSA